MRSVRLSAGCLFAAALGLAASGCSRGLDDAALRPTNTNESATSVPAKPGRDPTAQKQSPASGRTRTSAAGGVPSAPNKESPSAGSSDPDPNFGFFDERQEPSSAEVGRGNLIDGGGEWRLYAWSERETVCVQASILRQGDSATPGLAAHGSKPWSCDYEMPIDSTGSQTRDGKYAWFGAADARTATVKAEFVNGRSRQVPVLLNKFGFAYFFVDAGSDQVTRLVAIATDGRVIGEDRTSQF